MEPERKIEKLLRAYAKKRRVGTGDAFTLHPATRRRLQAEIDRQFAEPPEENRFRCGNCSANNGRYWRVSHL